MALVSGCAKGGKIALVGGIEDYIVIPQGTVLKQVPLGIADDNPAVDIVTQKSGVWMSLDARNRALSVRGE
jgi:hypothetical protein